MANEINYFLGIGQGEWSERWLKKHVQAVSFHAAPNYLKYSSDEEFQRCAVEWVKKSIGKKKPVIILAESQAAPAVTYAIRNGHIELPRMLVLVQPLGLNKLLLGSDNKSRRRSLLRRSLKFWMRKNQRLTIYGNFMTAATIIGAVLHNPRRLAPALTFAVNQDITSDLVWLSTKTNVRIIAADKDDLFPYKELKKYVPGGISLQLVSGAHVNRATPGGIKELNAIIGSL